MFARTLGNSTSRTATWRFTPQDKLDCCKQSRSQSFSFVPKILLAFDIRLWQGRGDFDLCNFTVRLATSLEFHFLPGIGARAEKQDPRDLAVNIHLVKALIEIVRCGCCRLPAFRYFLRSKRRGAGLNDFHFLVDQLFRRLTCGFELGGDRRPIGERDRTGGLELLLERGL